MKSMRPLLLLPAGLILAACATTPDTHPELTRLENRLDNDLRDPEITRVARAELEEADERLDLARIELDDDGVSGDFMHQLYLADRWLDIAEARTELNVADRRAAQLANERDEIVLKARLSRSEIARLEAEAEAVLARQRASTAETARDLAAAQAMDQSLRAREAEQQALTESLRAQQAEQQAMTESQRARQAEQEALAATERAGDAYLTAEQARERARAAEIARAEAQADAAQVRAELSELKTTVAELDAVQTERGLVLTLDDVLFEFDSAVLTSGGERHLDKLAAFLRAHPERHVRVEGFTDSVGSEDYNAMLSERRAIAVAERLIVNGVSPERVVAEGYGENYPVATNNTEAGRQQNRRVEVVIALDDEGEVEDRVVFVPSD